MRYDYVIDENPMNVDDVSYYVIDGENDKKVVFSTELEEEAKSLVEHLNSPQHIDYGFDGNRDGEYDLLDGDGQPFLTVDNRDVAIELVHLLNGE